MDGRLQGILALLLSNIDVLNEEIVRMGKSEQFAPTDQCLHMIDRIRDTCMCSLQNLCSIERMLQRGGQPPGGWPMQEPE